MNLFSLIIQPLENASFDYMISGSVAAMMYGEPRMTNDIDIILAITRESLPKLAFVFPESEFYIAPHEILLTEIARAQRGHTNIIHHHTGFRADIYFRASDPLHAWAWQHRQRGEIKKNLLAWFAPPEYVILRKLEYYAEGGSEKHTNDIIAMLQQPHLSSLKDSSDILGWARKLGVTEIWTKICLTLD